MRQFVITGSPADYYTEKSNADGATQYSANRVQVRRLVEVYCGCINDVIDEGGNPHTASLDMTDVINDFMANEPAEAQTAFYTMYAQEMNAATSSTIDRTIKLNAETAKNEANLMQIGQWVGALIFLLIFLAFLFK